jgi:hypothetical protein
MQTGLNMSDMTDWLLGHVNETLMIRKDEDGDVDQVTLQLKKVTYHAAQPEADDYVDDSRIILHGEGRVSIDGGGGAAELPRDSYEITLAGDCSASVRDNELHINTERASFRLGALRH